jgi:8-oxo-dGTP diphosphatase
MADQQPLVSIDVVPLRFNREAGAIEFATGARIFEPFIGEQALPGVLLNSGESIEAAATRALDSKVGLPSGLFRQLGAYDSSNRDPRGASISIVLLSAQSNAAESKKAVWHATAPKLPFDHEVIVREAYDRASQALWRDVSFTRSLLGERFTTADAVAIGSPTPHASNARRWFETWPHVRRVENLSKSGAVGRPAVTWEWVTV